MNQLMGGSKTHLLLLSLHHILLFRSLAGVSVPKDCILINCGGNDTVTLDDGRSFRPDGSGSGSGSDSPSSFIFSPNSSNVVSISPFDIYGSARVFTEDSEYVFGIPQEGRYLLRLHFRPISNSLYDLQSAAFSVMADGFTLLHNFSFSKSNKLPSVVFKEYVVELGSGSKALTLKLSPFQGSIAFINAIEVISLSPDQLPSAASPVPGGPAIEIPARVAFETAYRVNVGGPLLSSRNDTLWRSWETDHPFLINPASARSVSTDPDSIVYPSVIPITTAPRLVYATAQEMADANVGNQKFNISWVFVVDSGFSYLVRLHFCDFISKRPQNLVFNVYINNQSALSSFDLSHKAMGLSTAYVADFLVGVNMESDRILVQVGPPQISSIPPNAILNGLEIMKLSNSDGSLDGSHSANPISLQATKKGGLPVIVIASCFGGITILGLMIAAFVLYFHKQKKAEKLALTCLPPSMPLPSHMSNSLTKVSVTSYASSRPSLGLGQLLAFSEIREATNDFDEKLVLGVGGFGKVYKGMLENGLVVAVKRGDPRCQQGLVEFKTGIEILSKLRHRHLVSLIGYCHELNEMVLVYEFMAGGSLRKHLYGSELPALSWKERLDICIGAAKGLHYLHTGASESIIHRDVKTANILLDENLTAKVADFGSSKLGPTLDQTHVNTVVKGSFGYLDPDYFRRQQLTEKSDVYSFGVVLVEVLCARPAINPALPRDQVNIVEWAMNWQKRGLLEQIIDPRLVGTVGLDSLRKFGETAEKCLAEFGLERPRMGDVLWNLEYALQLHESLTTLADDGNSANNIHDLPEWIPHVGALEQDDSSVVSNETDATTTRLFSQLIDPKGR